MTLQRFQSIVLKLSNQMFIRHYLWLNYPQDPQLMGIEFTADQLVSPRLIGELFEAGFKHREGDRYYTVVRTEDAKP